MCRHSTEVIHTLPLGQSALHSFAFRQGVAGGAFSNLEVVVVSVEVSGEGGGIGLDIYCQKVLPHVFHLYSFCFVFFLFAFL